MSHEKTQGTQSPAEQEAFNDWFDLCERKCISQAEWIPDPHHPFWRQSFEAALTPQQATDKFFETQFPK